MARPKPALVLSDDERQKLTTWANRPKSTQRLASTSWLNQVERFFAEITEKRIRRGVFRSVKALEQAILGYLEEHNVNPKPFAWVADADSILDRVKKVCERTFDSGH